MPGINVGDTLPRRTLETIQLEHIELPGAAPLTHLQFRRFVGCPVCNLHLRSFIQRHDELVAGGIREIAVFHSSRAEMLRHHAEAPFALVADPEKALYRAFGVEKSVWSLLHPGSWRSMVRGARSGAFSLPERGQTVLGLPADFLIAGDGRVLARKYGRHAGDHWNVDELLEMAGRLVGREA